MQNDNSDFKKEFVARLVRFTIAILRLASKLRDDRNLWAVADQVIRSGSSVGANVVEAKAASSRRDYIKFFEIALKSANETRYWLIVIREYNAAYKSESDTLLVETDEICKIIGSSVLTLKGKK
ncbi:MAG: four helix bundle protein [bacterium]|nr:four helix bundle protein [bacterium]